MSLVSAVPASPSAIAREHFRRRLGLETDCAEVAAALEAGPVRRHLGAVGLQSQAAALGAGPVDFVLLHVAGSQAAFEARHVPGAVYLPHRLITAERVAAWPADTLFVVYCAGPHCNGADRAALRLAELGRPVKLMLGGLTGWADEGLAFARGATVPPIESHDEPCDHACSFKLSLP
jgi:rhodanese-related sulfurtransferase